LKKILLITPPLVQINTPYPATAFLKGFLNARHIDNYQMDLGIELILEILSSKGLRSLKEYIISQPDLDCSASLVWHNFEEYIATIDTVISFLQNKNSTIAYSIVSRQFLPESLRFKLLEEQIDLFSENDIQDKARHYATLYIEDICDFISDFIDPHFGLSRYAESIARSAVSFDELYNYVHHEERTWVMQLCFHLLQRRLEDIQADIIAWSIPFPGNLTSALCMSVDIKKIYPHIKIIMGGGYCNTELREINDERLFECVDFMTLDDGERPIEQLMHFIAHDQDYNNLVRTFTLNTQGQLEYFNNPNIKDYTSAELPAPSYQDLDLESYLSVIDLVNPMHRLWSDGRWNKMILAHGCYWAKCTFCDVGLSYIADYHHAEAAQIVNHIEQLIQETGQRGFHFVDEAAPPALIRDVCIELIKRQVKITWWTNIRFEKNFTQELCQLMAQSGCIAVSGGLEVASNRLLKLINKGVTVEQVAQVCQHFKENGILVHAYLMYGFPTQTAQETIDALEMVRQLFDNEVLTSAYWHKFTMTVHSPCGQQPELFQVKAQRIATPVKFAVNDVEHEDPTGADHEIFSEGLKKALYNYMLNNCLDVPVHQWFDFKVPKTTISKRYISQAIENKPATALQGHKRMLWMGVIPQEAHYHFEDGVCYWTIYTKRDNLELELEEEYGQYLIDMLRLSHISRADATRVKDWKQAFEERIPDDSFESFILEEIYPHLRHLGLICI